MEINLGTINIKKKINIGDLKTGIKKIYPSLEKLEVNPSGEKQVFKHPESYGYDEVIVNAVGSEEINFTPSSEEQIKEGLFKKVTVDGDENLIPENIKKDVEIFGVRGKGVFTDIKLSDASYLFYNGARTELFNEFLDLCENVTNVQNMFGFSGLKVIDISNLDISALVNMKNFFYQSTKTEKIILGENFNTENVTSMEGMFGNCYALDLSNIDFTKFNTSKVTTMQNMFQGYKKSTLDLRGFNTENVTSMYQMFSSSNIINLDLSSFNLVKLASLSNAFYNCENLTNLKSFCNLGKIVETGYSGNVYCYLNKSNKLTKESLLDVINTGLYDMNVAYDVENGGTLGTSQLVLGATNIAKLTAEEIEIATNKRLVCFLIVCLSF